MQTQMQKEYDQKMKSQCKRQYVIITSLLLLGVVFFQPAVHGSEIERIDKLTSKIDDLIKDDGRTIKIYCDTAGDSNLIEIGSYEEAPERSYEIYTILYDSTGNIVCYYEVPVSWSGDWFSETSHYFDKNGDLIKLTYHFSYFSGCADTSLLIRDNLTKYYHEGQIIKTNHSFMDSDGNELLYEGCYMSEQNFKKTGMSSEPSCKGVIDVIKKFDLLK